MKFLSISNICIFLMASAYFIWRPAIGAENPTHTSRYGLFIAAEDGGANREHLVYAADDAAKIARVFQELGSLTQPHTVLLKNPKAEEIEQAFSFFRSNLSASKTLGERSEFIFYYSGHSDENRLIIGANPLPYQVLRDKISALDSNLRLVILDSCSSGALIRAKGGVKRKAFMSEKLNNANGYAFLTSSSSEEISQESDQIGGSFFTLSLVSALRGAADIRRDGKISLISAYQYAYQDTLEKTSKSAAGTQHANFDIQISGSGEVVLTELKTNTSKIVFEAELEGTFFLRDAGQKILAEVSKKAGESATLAVPAGNINVAQKTKSTFIEANLLVTEGQTKWIKRNDFSKIDLGVPKFKQPPFFSQLVLGSLGGGFASAGCLFAGAIIGHALDRSAVIGYYTTVNGPVIGGVIGFALGDLFLSTLIVSSLAETSDYKTSFGVVLTGAAIGTAIAVPLTIGLAFNKSGSDLVPAFFPIFLPGLTAALFSQIFKQTKNKTVWYAAPNGSGFVAGFSTEF